MARADVREGKLQLEMTRFFAPADEVQTTVDAPADAGSDGACQCATVEAPIQATPQATVQAAEQVVEQVPTPAPAHAPPPPEIVIDTKQFLCIAKAIKQMHDEATLSIEQAQIHARIMDPSHTVMVDVTIPREACVEYRADGAVKVPLNLEDLVNFLKLVDGSRVTVTVNDGRFWVGDGTTTNDLPLLDLKEEEADVDVSRITPTTEVELSAQALLAGMKKADSVANHVRIHAREDGTILLEALSDRGNTRHVIRGNDVLSFNGRPAKACYSVECLKRVLSEMPQLCKTLKLRFADDTPCQVVFTLPTSTSKATVIFWIAPYVEGE